VKVLLEWLRRLRLFLIEVWRGIVEPPAHAIQRALEALFSRVGASMRRFLAFWRHLFAGPVPDDKAETRAPTKTALLLASVLLGLTLYTWPAPQIIPSGWFIVLATLLLFGFFRTVQFASVRGSNGRWERFLRASERRVGLVWWERLGAALGLGLSVYAVMRQPELLPVTLGVLFGFVTLLGQPPDVRELVTVRPVPDLPPPVPDLPDPASTEPAGGAGGGGTDPEHPSGEYVRRDFSWSVHRPFGVDTQELGLYIHEPTYRQVQAANPGRRWDSHVPRYDVYVVDGTTPDIDRAAAALHEISDGSRYSTYEEVSSILAFVQAIPYASDVESAGAGEYWRFPIETLYDQVGDCEDSTILAAAILRRLGHNVVAIDLPDHAALGVEIPVGLPGHYLEHDGKRMYYCETTVKGWIVGELPSHYADASATIVPIPPYR